MKMSGVKRNWNSSGSHRSGWKATLLLAALAISTQVVRAQAPAAVSQRIQQLTDAMAKTQAQVDESQHELNEMRKQLIDLQRQIGQDPAPSGNVPPPVSADESSSAPAQAAAQSMNSAIEEMQEHQSVEESEIATQAQSKVESESKYPVKVTGMLLMTGFVNRGGVDTPATPSVAVPGAGNAGASIKQTMLGFDAEGPHLFGARSFADLRVDFYGSQASSTSPASYSGYYTPTAAMLRLRTAHAGLYWNKTQAYFALDRPIVSPEEPTSLTALAEPALAWSGNLWTWNPQAVVSDSLGPVNSGSVQLQAALIDPGDAPLTPAIAPSSTSTTTPPNGITPPTSTERTSKPGAEARIAVLGSVRDENRNHFGVGGYFAPHQSSLGRSFDSWAATADARLLLPARLQFTGSFYRGLALGGLGGGAYKDFAYSLNPNTGGYYFRPLDDVGGWAQLKEKVSERLEFNGAYGTDNVFAGQLRRYYLYDGPMVQNLARNRTFAGNFIYSPSAYLLFSLEYRRLESFPVEGLPSQSNIIGVGAGYKF
jgi:hypothetical protein